jgi:hypothetical protein
MIRVARREVQLKGVVLVKLLVSVVVWHLKVAGAVNPQ